MPDTDNNEFMSQDELDALLNSLSDDLTAAGDTADTSNETSPNTTPSTGIDSNDDLKDLLNKNDDDFSDDDLDNLVNMLNQHKSQSETKFNDTYSEGFEDDGNVLKLPAEDLFSAEPEYEPEVSPISREYLEELSKPPNSPQTEEDDIDALLSKMPVSTIDFSPETTSFVQNITTYDGEQSDKESEHKSDKTTEEKSKKEKRPLFDIKKNKFIVIIINSFNKVSSKVLSILSKSEDIVSKKLPNKALIIIMGVVSVLVLVFGALMVNTIIKLNNTKAEQKLNIMQVFNKAPAVVNNSNFIYTSLAVPWNGWDFTMRKMLLDSEASMFYFDRHMNLDSVDVTLTDEAGNIYGLDIPYYSDILKGDNKATDMLRFQPLPAGASLFTLNIYDLVSKEVMSFPIELQTPIEYMPVKYLSEPLEIDLNDDNIRLIIEDAVFASSGTTIMYNIEKYSSNSTLLFAGSEYINSNSISIEGAGRGVLPNNIFPTQYDFPSEGLSIGRMNFNPLASITGNVTINFKNMYKKVTKDMEIDISNLFYDEKKYQITINSAPYKVVLERIGYFGSMYALIYHAENASIVQKQMDENMSLNKSSVDAADIEVEEPEVPKTLQANMSATLIVSLEDGRTIEIEGTNRATNIGGEVHFILKGVEGLPNYIERDSLSLKINDISFKMPDTSTKIDLNSLKSTQRTTQHSIVSNFLSEAFDNRLKVKSGEKDISSLQSYFDDSVIGNTSLSDAYAPLSLEGKTQYTSQIISLAQKNEKKYIAAVGVTWNGVIDGKEIHFYRTHNLIIEYQSSGWRITHDEMI